MNKRNSSGPLRIWFAVSEEPEVAELGALISKRIDNRDYFAGFGTLSALNQDLWDAIVPLGLEVQLVLAEKDGLYEKCLVPSIEAMQTCDDKRACNEKLKGLGFGDVVIGPPDPAGPSYPYVAKSRRGDQGEGTLIISSPLDESEQDAFLKREDVFRQRVVPGRREYAAHLIVVDGVVHFQRTICHEMAQDISVKGRVEAKKMRSRALDHDPFAPLLGEMLTALNFRGAACIDYKIENGRPLVMEINPRAGNSVLLHINPFLDAYCTALGLSPQLTPQERGRIETRRRWSRRWQRWRNAVTGA